MPFTLPELPFALDALEPHFDATTMGIHHGKHHAAYVQKANAALAGTSLEAETCPWTVCAKMGELDESKQTAVRNNAGGHANHSLFWKILAPAGKGGAPSATLASAIDAAFGSMDGFKEQFAAAGATRFGSGWAWLCMDDDKKLCIGSTANQDNPVMAGGCGCSCAGKRPILGLDVWEHAYYLKYQNRRPDYIQAFFNVLNWNKVSEYFDQTACCNSSEASGAKCCQSK